MSTRCAIAPGVVKGLHYGTQAKVADGDAEVLFSGHPVQTLRRWKEEEEEESREACQKKGMLGQPNTKSTLVLVCCSSILAPERVASKMMMMARKKIGQLCPTEEEISRKKTKEEGAKHTRSERRNNHPWMIGPPTAQAWMRQARGYEDNYADYF